MQYKNFKKIFEEKHKVKFKLYSMEYIIELKDDEVIIYSLADSNKKYKFKSFDEALKKYTIYNESIRKSIKEIEILE